MKVTCPDCGESLELKKPYKCKACKAAINPYLFIKPKVYDKLKKIRSDKSLSLKPSKFLKNKIVDIFGAEEDLNIRYYQVQGIMHLLLMRKMLLGDATGIGKTLQTIAAYTYLLEKDPNLKCLVVAPKSALEQWVKEFGKFTKGITALKVTSKGGPKKRKELYKKFADENYNVMVMNYHLLMNDWEEVLASLRDDPEDLLRSNDFVIVFDEAAAFKTRGSKTWNVVKEVSAEAKTCYALTATPIKNCLEEVFNIYKAIKPDLFPGPSTFMKRYCKTKLVRIPGKRFKLPVITGYKNLDEFRKIIDPYYLGRKVENIGEQLPELTFKDIRVEMNAGQLDKYREILAGLLKNDAGEEKEVTKLTQITYLQELVSNPELLEIDGKSTKEEEFLRLIEEEFVGEKIIVYTRFRSWIDILEEKILKRNAKKDDIRKIYPLRITGKENDEQRELNKLLFLGNWKAANDYADELKAKKKWKKVPKHIQKCVEEKLDPNVIIVNKAGVEAVNLQSARIMILLDIPISYGDFIQLLGRGRRLDSKHEKILVTHMMSVLPPKYRYTSIDEKMVKIVRGKKGLNDILFGEAFEFRFEGDMIDILYNELKNDAQKWKK